MSALIALEEQRESLALDLEQAAQLEGRHRANEKAMELLPTQSGKSTRPALVCLGKESFLSMGAPAVNSALAKENARLWAEIEEIQMRITKKERELEEAAEVERTMGKTVPANR